MKNLSKVVLMLIVGVPTGLFLFQNCAPEVNSGLSFGIQKSVDDPTGPGGSGNPAPGSSPPPAVTATPPPQGAFVVIQDQSDWNPGEDVIDDQNPNATPEELAALIAAKRQANANWFNAQANGPVTSYTMYVMRTDSGIVPTPDSRGCLRVQVGDRIFVDTTQRNASGVAQCKWANKDRPNMTWFSTNQDNFWPAPKDFQPFWVRFKPQVAGQDTWIYATLDGVRSNYLCLTTK